MAQETLDAVIVGAGFSGLYMLHKLRGQGLACRVYEAGAGVGGTWFWNRYPGARVDIESQEYSYTFDDGLADEWEWSERYASQPELLRYLNHVADRFDLRRDIRLETRVESAAFIEGAARWRVRTNTGEDVSAKFVVMATGCLSVPQELKFDGAERFKGESYRTSSWPHEGVDFTGKRVGVIGTGSSAIQSIPEIARQAAHVTVFQRTPNYSVPAHNAPTTKEQLADWRVNRKRYREEAMLQGFGVRQIDGQERSALDATPEERQAAYEDRWARGGFSLGGAFADIVVTKEANDTAAAFVAGKIKSIVKDPATAELLTPKTYPLFTKRLCVDTGYYDTFNRDNVSLVDVSADPIQAITPDGLRTAKQAYAFDAIVYAIGFDAMTGALNKIDIAGRGGVKLKDQWAEGPRAHLGLMVAGFPNMFIVTGPGSPSVLCNMALAIEQHVEWIADCIAYLGARQIGAIEATAQAQDAWVAHVNDAANMTLYPQANSWYMGANIPGKPRVFMPYIGGFPLYKQACDAAASADYEGFALTRG